MTSRTLAKRIANLALTKKAHDVILMDLRKITSTADFFVVCSADSDTQVKAIADEIRDGAEVIGSPAWHYEGYQALSWVILDFVDVVAHVFHRDARSFYKLERLWGDADISELHDEDGLSENKAPKRKRSSPSAARKKKTSR